MYRVFHFRTSSPTELESWLNEMWRKMGLELVTADGDYFIFKNPAEIETWELSQTTDAAKPGLEKASNG